MSSFWTYCPEFQPSWTYLPHVITCVHVVRIPPTSRIATICNFQQIYENSTTHSSPKLLLHPLFLLPSKISNFPRCQVQWPLVRVFMEKRLTAAIDLTSFSPIQGHTDPPLHPSNWDSPRPSAGRCSHRAALNTRAGNGASRTGGVRQAAGRGAFGKTTSLFHIFESCFFGFFVYKDVKQLLNVKISFFLWEGLASFHICCFHHSQTPQRLLQTMPERALKAAFPLDA